MFLSILSIALAYAQRQDRQQLNVDFVSTQATNGDKVSSDGQLLVGRLAVGARIWSVLTQGRMPAVPPPPPLLLNESATRNPSQLSSAHFSKVTKALFGQARLVFGFEKLLRKVFKCKVM